MPESSAALRRPGHAAMLVGVWAASIGAVAIVVIAQLTRHYLCLDGDHPSCVDGDPSTAMTSQWVLSYLVALLAGVAWVGTVRRQRHVFLVGLLLYLVLAVAWAVLCDQVTHRRI